VVDDSFLLCFSAHDEPIEFRMPSGEYARTWEVLLDTHNSQTPTASPGFGESISVGPQALMVLRRLD
jgi:glycogen operon protein